MNTIGILGAGKLGTVLGRLATLAGFRTLIAASGHPEAIELVVNVMSPGAIATTAAEAAREADVVVLALPLRKYRTIPTAGLAGKVVVDAMNYWPEVDGTLPEFESARSSSEVIQAFLSGTLVVKTFSQLGYHQLEEDARPMGDPQRHALAVAGNDGHAVDVVADLVDRMGFDPVLAGPLASARRFAPGSSAFGVSTDRAHLEQLLGLPTSYVV